MMQMMERFFENVCRQKNCAMHIINCPLRMRAVRGKLCSSFWEKPVRIFVLRLRFGVIMVTILSWEKIFYANHNLVILDCARVTFGNHVFVAPNCGFYTAGHPIDFKRRNQGLEYAYPITVGNHVWIGAGVQIMPGVTIGDNVVIGGGSVVVKDIPSNSVAVGNPCKVVRAVTDEDQKKNWDR